MPLQPTAFFLVLAFGLPLSLGLSSSLAAGEGWPQWRGPDGQGHAEVQGLPRHWSETKNVTWKTPVPGKGWSSPVIAGDEIWMTTGVDRPATQRETKQRLETNTGNQPLTVSAEVSLRAVCVHKRTGELLYNIELLNEKSPQWIHQLNSYASPTPVLADGKLYCHFGTYGTACLETSSGEVLWTNRDLPIMHENGPGSSPVLWENRLIFHCDGSDLQYIAALDARTGEVAWKTPRSGKMASNPQFKKSYATPLLVEVDGREVLLSPASDWLYAYDPADGRELWKLHYDHLGFSLVSRPVVKDGKAFFSTSFMRPQMLCVDYATEQPKILWRFQRAVPTMSSPLLVGDQLYFVSDKGVATCVNAKTGQRNWQHRLGGNFSASPMYADGLIFFCSREGITTLIKPGAEYNEVAKNELDGAFFASPAVAEGALILRTDRAVYRIEAQK